MCIRDSEYIDAVRSGRLYDPTLTFQIENGFEALCGLANYMTDPAVDSWASLIVWHNRADATNGGPVEQATTVWACHQNF